MVQEKLATLKTFGQAFMNRLFDNARTGESDKRVGLRDVDIAEHGEAGRYATRCRIGEYGDIWKSLRPQIGKRCRCLRHLQQGEQRFLHTCATAGGKRNHWQIIVGSMSCRTRETLTNDRAHRTTHERKLERTCDNRTAM